MKIRNKIKLDPQCFKGFPMAITNKGYLIPCCYCDDPKTMNDPEFQKLLAVSKISDNDNLEQIIFNKQWKRFEKNLRRHQGPHACMNTCKVREDKNNIIRKDVHIDPNSKQIIKTRNV